MSITLALLNQKKIMWGRLYNPTRWVLSGGSPITVVYPCSENCPVTLPILLKRMGVLAGNSLNQLPQRTGRGHLIFRSVKYEGIQSIPPRADKNRFDIPEHDFWQ